MKHALQALMRGDDFSSAQSSELMAMLLEGSAALEQVGALLTILHYRAPSAQILSGFAAELGAHRVPVPVSEQLRDRLVDVCGTGGDASGTFNVSTAVAFVASAAGLPIAKHGNRAISSRSGSFDVLEALGVSFADTPIEAASALQSDHLAFLYAPSFHPALRRLTALRKSLGFRTVLNALGPLLNPVGVKRQLIGVYSRDLVLPMAEALAELGVTSAMVVHGEDGMDEISLSAPTYIARLSEGKIVTSTFAPEDLKLTRVNAKVLAGGEPALNAQILESIFAGERSPRSEVVNVNAAAALLVGGMVDNLRDGFAIASEAQASGEALQLLKRLRSSRHEVAL